MRLRPGFPRCLLVVAPHADDETIGAHCLIARLRRRGVTVRIVVVTDGHASHPSSRLWPRRRLVRERRYETRRVMRQIGVPAGEVMFLGLPDGGLAAIEADVGRRIAKVMRAAPKPVLVVAPGPTDDHPDHRVVAAGVAATRIAGIRRLAYPVWPAGARPRSARTIALTTQERSAKRHAIRGYRTQAGLITDDANGFSMTASQIAAFSGPAEIFQETRR